MEDQNQHNQYKDVATSFQVAEQELIEYRDAQAAGYAVDSEIAEIIEEGNPWADKNSREAAWQRMAVSSRNDAVLADLLVSHERLKWLLTQPGYDKGRISAELDEVGLDIEARQSELDRLS